MTPEDARALKIEHIEIMEEQARRFRRRRMANFKPYPWQQKVFSSGAKNKQRLLMAANRVGKTYSAAIEVAFHVTGRYPDWWEGYRFQGPITCWALGVTGEQIRDVVQKALFGAFDEQGPDGTGAIPYEDIAGFIRSSQTKDLLKDVQVRHQSGGMSKVSLKAYSQGQNPLMGDSIDLIWIDEEPVDPLIYPQCLIRTATGDQGRGGIVLLTFTPENGMTSLVAQFVESLQPGQDLINVTWDDAPHLTKEVKEQILAAIPAYQRKMRSMGVPVMGSGLIFTVEDDEITCDPFQIPQHWTIINGCDFGWDHPQAHVQLAWDRDADVFYVINAWRKSERDAAQAWTAVKGWAKHFPVAWPHDGLQHDKGGGEVLAVKYRQAGFNMLPQMATWPMGGNSVEAGVREIGDRMLNGTFKVFKNLSEVFEEKRLYHRDKKGHIVKLRDDLLCAIRYAYMMARFSVPNVGEKPRVQAIVASQTTHWSR
tara:strand:+ start:31319 stop:32761 length:1443 start_codon:yes stop_codon:yes gene_type:complete